MTDKRSLTSPIMPSTTSPLNTSEIDVQALMRGLVHELRNPLSAILTASSLLQPNQAVDEESEMLVGVVQKESRRMNRILTEFSSFVKPPMPYIERFDLAALVRDVIKQLEKEESFGAHIQVQDELTNEIWVSGDVPQTAQVLRHVLVNAKEAMHEPGKLCITLCTEEPNSLCIEDSGPGLAHGAEERAFQPFFSTKPASTGLGLSIARGLLRAMDGNLQVENILSHGDEGEDVVVGARVRIDLPGATHAATARTTVGA